MNGDDLGDEIKAAIDAEPGFRTVEPNETPDAYRTRIMRAMGNAIVDHVTGNARVTINATVGAGIAVQVNPATGTGATTAPGTASTTAGTVA